MDLKGVIKIKKVLFFIILLVFIFNVNPVFANYNSCSIVLPRNGYISNTKVLSTQFHYSVVANNVTDVKISFPDLSNPSVYSHEIWQDGSSGIVEGYLIFTCNLSEGLNVITGNVSVQGLVVCSSSINVTYNIDTGPGSGSDPSLVDNDNSKVYLLDYDSLSLDERISLDYAYSLISYPYFLIFRNFEGEMSLYQADVPYYKGVNSFNLFADGPCEYIGKLIVIGSTDSRTGCGGNLLNGMTLGVTSAVDHFSLKFDGPYSVYACGYDLLNSDGFSAFANNPNNPNSGGNIISSCNFVSPRNGFSDQDVPILNIKFHYKLSSFSVDSYDVEFPDLQNYEVLSHEIWQDGSSGIVEGLVNLNYHWNYGENYIVGTLVKNGSIIAIDSITVYRLQGFIDEDGDGLDDRTGQPEYVPPSVDIPDISGSVDLVSFRLILSKIQDLISSVTVAFTWLPIEILGLVMFSLSLGIILRIVGRS